MSVRIIPVAVVKKISDSAHFSIFQFYQVVLEVIIIMYVYRYCKSLSVTAITSSIVKFLSLLVNFPL